MAPKWRPLLVVATLVLPAFLFANAPQAEASTRVVAAATDLPKTHPMVDPEIGCHWCHGVPQAVAIEPADLSGVLGLMK